MKKKFPTLFFLCLMITSFVVFACSTNSPDDFFEEISDTPDGTVPLVTFNTNVSPIIETSCVECHAGNTAEAGLQLENFDDVVSAVESRGLLDRIVDEDNPMPPSGLLPTQVTDVIFQWVEDGLLEDESE